MICSKYSPHNLLSHPFSRSSSMIVLILILNRLKLIKSDWDSWWTYEGISGPDFWGRLNPKWSHCSKGQRQSPIDIDTDLLIYDSILRPIEIKGDQIDGRLINTGRSIDFEIDLSSSSSSSDQRRVLITGGPLSYQYTITNLTVHFGRENDRGSEHTINQKQFAGELQLYGYNSQLYTDWSDAKRSPNGLVAIAILIKISRNHSNNDQLSRLIESFKNTRNRGDSQSMYSLSLRKLLPITRQFVTYEGSLTQPACFETVQWIILNKPIYLSSNQLEQLRSFQSKLWDNYRPIQAPNFRTIRTNIVNHRLIENYRFKYQLDGREILTDVYHKHYCVVNQPIAYRST
ncbi:FCH and double SH3 domains protein 2-like [Sarcoptes scabiei]|nr:FCH and double SH3 domains protein 2-like [Sarcoptes scabiei]